MAELLSVFGKQAGRALGVLVALVAAAGMLWQSVGKTNFTEDKLLTEQKQFTEMFVN